MPSLKNVKKLISVDIHVSTPVQLKEEEPMEQATHNNFSIAAKNLRSRLNKFSDLKVKTGQKGKQQTEVKE